MSAWAANSRWVWQGRSMGMWKKWQAIFPSHLEIHRKKPHCIWGNYELMVLVQARGVLDILPPGEHRNSPPEIPACVGNEPQQEPQIPPHLAISPELWEISVRSNRCLSVLAWVHLRIQHLGSNVLGKLRLPPSGSGTSHRPPLPASFTWQLQLPPKADHQGILQEQIQPVLLCSLPVSPAEDTTDKTGHPKETCRLMYFFASQPASAARTFVQIVAADLPPPQHFALEKECAPC